MAVQQLLQFTVVTFSTDQLVIKVKNLSKEPRDKTLEIQFVKMLRPNDPSLTIPGLDWPVNSMPDQTVLVCQLDYHRLCLKSETRCLRQSVPPAVAGG